MPTRKPPTKSSQKRQLSIDELSPRINLTTELDRIWTEDNANSEVVYNAWKQRYYDLPDQFIKDCIDWDKVSQNERRTVRPAEYQLEIARELNTRKRASVRAPHGAGKSGLSSWIILWFALTRDGEDWKIPTLASAWRQLKEYLWPEVHKWTRYLRWDLIGRQPFRESDELLTLSIRLETGQAFALTSDDPNLIEGAHEANLLYIFDESKAIMDGTWDSAEGAMSSGNCVLPSTIVTGASREIVSRRWYVGDVIEITTKLGYRLTVTPDHPILTPAGWQRAAFLRQFDDVICCGNTQALMSAVEPDTDHVPTTIEDLFNSLPVSSNFGDQFLVVSSSVNLDTDVLEPQIDVVSPYCFLRRDEYTALIEKIEHLQFVAGIEGSDCLLSARDLFQMLLRQCVPRIAEPSSARALKGPVGVLRHSDIYGLLGVSKGNVVLFETLSDRVAADSVTLTHFRNRKLFHCVIPDKLAALRRFPFSSTLRTPYFDAVIDKTPEDGTWVDPKLLANFRDRLPGTVLADQVESIVTRTYSGHVYNLQTATHWYLADANSTTGGIITHNCMWLAISTPGVPAGRFYDIQKRKPGYHDWWVRHIKLQEAIAAGRIEKKWADARREQWGEKDPRFQNRVEGEFAASEIDAVIPLHWIEAATERWYEIETANAWSPVNTIGVDVGRSSDYTVFALRCEQGIKELVRYNNENSTQVASRVEALLRTHRQARAIVDVIGIGAGVYDILLEKFPERVFPFNASAGTDFRDTSDAWGFSNTRSAAWWNMRQILEPITGQKIALPPDDILQGDFTTPTYKTIGHARYQVMSKEDIKKEIGRSTDAADAVIHAYWDGAEFGAGFA